ncbi:MAG: DUF7133 domain-containing protein [Opitutaceae bacterium]
MRSSAPSTFLRALIALGLDPAARGQTPPSAETPRFTPEVADFVENFKPGGQDFSGQAVSLSAEEVAQSLQAADGFEVELVARAPAVRQPLDLRFDDRGRMWVVQYLQYPFPAGLTVTSYDQYLRAEYNRVSPPPPHHFRGADKITIHEDRDGDGRFETSKVFLDGLNMATSVLPDTGGAWVLMSPYLLFYPDRNGDDAPDGDPEAHLTGFGLEDTHSLANSLHWGPDGWIHGAKGSTTTLNIQECNRAGCILMLRLFARSIRRRWSPPTRSRFAPWTSSRVPTAQYYIADWAGLRLSHLNPRDTWVKSTGRIFRTAPEGFTRPATLNLRAMKTADLIGVLSHANREHREHARRLLGDRPENIAPVLQAMVKRNAPAALEAFWVLNLRGELDEARRRQALRHPNEHIRRWAVRLIGDTGRAVAATAAALSALARTETAVEVRSQLASSARRLPAGQAFPIIRGLLGRDEDVNDKHLPLLIWWAIEAKADAGREELPALVGDPAIWETKIFSAHIAWRIGMRYTEDQGPRKRYTLEQGVYSEWLIDRVPEHLYRNLVMCGRLLAAAPAEARASTLIAGMAKGLTGSRVDSVPPNLQEEIARLWTGEHSTDLICFAARIGWPNAMSEAVAAARSGALPEADLRQYMDLFAETAPPEALPLVANLARTEKNEARRTRWLAALEGFDDVAAAEVLFEIFPTLSPRLQNTAQRMLSEKPAWSLAMLQRMNRSSFAPGMLSSSNLALMRGHDDPRITSLLNSYQQQHSDDPNERLARQLFENGKTAYNLTCAPCHQESGTGLARLAPPLVGSRWLQESDDVLVRILLHGKESPGRGLVMPPWRQFDDQQIAAILTYVRREFGQQDAAVTARKVGDVRAETVARRKAWTDLELDRLASAGEK